MCAGTALGWEAAALFVRKFAQPQARSRVNPATDALSTANPRCEVENIPGTTVYPSLVGQAEFANLWSKREVGQRHPAQLAQYPITFKMPTCAGFTRSECWTTTSRVAG